MKTTIGGRSLNASCLRPTFNPVLTGPPIDKKYKPNTAPLKPVIASSSYGIPSNQLTLGQVLKNSPKNTVEVSNVLSIAEVLSLTALITTPIFI